MENCSVPERSPESTTGKIFLLVKCPVPLGEYSSEHHLSEGPEEKYSPDNKIFCQVKKSSLVLPVKSKQVAKGKEHEVTVLFIFVKLTDNPGTPCGAVLELFRKTGGILCGVDHLVVVETVAGDIGLIVTSEGDSVLLLSRAGEVEINHYEPAHDKLVRILGVSLNLSVGQLYSPAGRGKE